MASECFEAAQAAMEQENRAGREAVKLPARARRSKSKASEKEDEWEAKLNVVAGEVGVLQTMVNEVVEDLTDVRGELQSHKEEAAEAMARELAILREEVRRSIEAQDVLQAKVAALEEEVKEAKDESKVCRRLIAQGEVGGRAAPRLDVPRPMCYGGNRSATEIDNFLFAVEQYLEGMNVSDVDQMVKATARYFNDSALMWWRQRSMDGRVEFASWDEFKSTLKTQFYPTNVVYEARWRLRELRQTGAVKDYVKSFQEIILQIPDMTTSESTFAFIAGLQNWAKVEVQRRDPKDLYEAYAMAESLVDLRGTFPRTEPRDRAPRESRPRAPAPDRNRSYVRRERGEMVCFRCRGPHMLRDCPNTPKLAAMTEEHGESSEGAEARVNALQLVGAVVNHREEGSGTGRMFVEAKIGRRVVNALIDTGATHSFMETRLAERQGLKLAATGGAIKAVNSAAQPIKGIARQVPIELGAWKGTVNFSVVPLDDYQVILGTDFLEEYRAVPVVSSNTLLISDQRATCAIPVKREGLAAQPKLSAMQVLKGFKKGCPTFLASLKLNDEEMSQTSRELPKPIQQVLTEFQSVMPPSLPKQLPPRREIDHAIEVIPGSKIPAGVPYRMAPHELQELRRQLQELLEAGFIQPSKSPYGAPVLFQKKHDGSLRLCIDYRGLNKITVKNRYPIPNIADLFDQLGGARWFTKLDLRSGYYQVRIATGDEPKTTCVTRYGSYEFLVMPFGLTNAPATFCTMMNRILSPFLDKFAVVYLDDIVIFSATLEEHEQHLKQVLGTLQKNQLFVKREKCIFAAQEIPFLGHIVGSGVLKMDKAKVEAISAWEAPRKLTELRSFLGLTNYYRRFIQGYSRICAPLTDLMKKEQKWEWDGGCQRAFEELKQRMVTEPVLRLPDFSRRFEVQVDASDLAIGGVLLQEGHPLAFESRKLNDTERRYTTQEKEMTAVVHCLRTWRHYLLSSPFTVYTDNVATSYFLSQKKLTPKQARWQDFLAEFDFALEYKPGKLNTVADALSRKHEVAAVSKVANPFEEKIKEGLIQDPYAKALRDYAEKGKTRRFWVQGDLLLTRGRRVYVPRWGNLRKEILRDCHDSAWAGHPGMDRTRALLEKAYYWPRMRDDIETYVRTCLICQQDKLEQGKAPGLLDPLPTPERPWASISLDFITSLPKNGGCEMILVIVDRFSKYGTFIPTTKECPSEEAARLVFKHVVKYWGLPQSIVSDRDPRFASRFWKELFKLMGTKLNTSSSFHPQTDGQTERVNALLEVYLRHYVNANQKNWAALLDIAQFSYNLQRSESTRNSPFEVVTGQQPYTPSTLPARYEGNSPAAFRFARDWKKQREQTQVHLAEATERMRKWADKSRRPRTFQTDDMVLLRILPNQTRWFARLHKGLIRKYEGPFRIIKKIGDSAYRLELPSNIEVHPVFHVSMLKPFKADEDDETRNISARAPITTTTTHETAVQKVIRKRVIPKRGMHAQRTEYLVKWDGRPDSEDTWEKETDLWQFRRQIEDFENQQRHRDDA